MTETGHELHAIREAEVIGQHTLRLVFEDGITRIVDLSPVLMGKRFGPLRNPDFFKKVRLNPDFETVEWPNGADFDPETLYYWDRYMPAMKEAAEGWMKREQEMAQ
jgi:hypothetical protein